MRFKCHLGNQTKILDPSIQSEFSIESCSVKLAYDSSETLLCPYNSGYRGNFVTVAGVKDIWFLIVSMFPVPARKGEHRKNERSQQHRAPAEVKRQVVRLSPVKEPPWKVMTETDILRKLLIFLGNT